MTSTSSEYVFYTFYLDHTIRAQSSGDLLIASWNDFDFTKISKIVDATIKVLQDALKADCPPIDKQLFFHICDSDITAGIRILHKFTPDSPSIHMRVDNVIRSFLSRTMSYHCNLEKVLAGDHDLENTIMTGVDNFLDSSNRKPIPIPIKYAHSEADAPLVLSGRHAKKPVHDSPIDLHLEPITAKIDGIKRSKREVYLIGNPDIRILKFDESKFLPEILEALEKDESIKIEYESVTDNRRRVLLTIKSIG